MICWEFIKKQGVFKLNLSDLHNIKYFGIIFRTNGKDNDNVGLYIEEIESYKFLNDKSLSIVIERKEIPKELLYDLIDKDSHFVYVVLENNSDIILHCRLTEIHNEPGTLGFVLEADRILEKASHQFQHTD